MQIAIDWRPDPVALLILYVFVLLLPVQAEACTAIIHNSNTMAVSASVCPYGPYIYVLHAVDVVHVVSIDAMCISGAHKIAIIRV